MHKFISIWCPWVGSAMTVPQSESIPSSRSMVVSKELRISSTASVMTPCRQIGSVNHLPRCFRSPSCHLLRFHLRPICGGTSPSHDRALRHVLMDSRYIILSTSQSRLANCASGSLSHPGLRAVKYHRTNSKIFLRRKLPCLSHGGIDAKVRLSMFPVFSLHLAT